jgi:DNA-binding MarR family transcriptional regulator
MKATASLRDRVRAQLADLKMPGALEALDGILSRIDGGQLGAADALEALLGAQISLRNTRRLVAAMRSSRLPAVKTLGDFDFTPGLFGVLVLIEANAGMKQTDLARTIHLDRSTVVNVIDNLETMKLVERRAVDGDRRSKALYLTSPGKAFLQKLKRQVLDHEKRLAANLSATDRQKLVDFLERIFPEHR